MLKRRQQTTRSFPLDPLTYRPSKTTLLKKLLKDMHIEQVPRSTEIRIGEKVPPNIELQTFPPLVAEKVPQVRTYKFFITENQIVVVNPQNVIADIIK